MTAYKTGQSEVHITVARTGCMSRLGAKLARLEEFDNHADLIMRLVALNRAPPAQRISRVCEDKLRNMNIGNI